jgi:hypothetical protein
VSETLTPGERIRGQALSLESYVRKIIPQSLRIFDLMLLFLIVIFFINNPVTTVAHALHLLNTGLLIPLFSLLPASLQLYRCWNDWNERSSR